MKQIAILLSLVLLGACSSESIEQMELKEPLQLNVTAGSYMADGMPDTRAMDNGNETTFEAGDRIGVIAIIGSTSVYDNIPYIYDGSAWVFDENSGESNKSECYYDNKATYIIYYPYSTAADKAMNENDIKKVIVPKTDQQSYDDYRASDLMVWTSAGVSPQKLNVQLKHAYPSVSLHPQILYEFDYGENKKSNFYISALDVAFAKGASIYRPYQADDESFRYILPAEGWQNSTLRYFYTWKDKTYCKEITLPQTLQANTRYNYSTQTISLGSHSLAQMAVGDYYCVKLGKGFLVSSKDKDITKEFNCIGVVFKVGAGNNDEATDYDGKLSQIHGYVVALKDAHESLGAWGYRTQNVVDIPDIQNEGITDEEKKAFPEDNSWPYDGYKNTKAVRRLPEYATTDVNHPYDLPQQYWAFKVAVEYDKQAATPAESSGWYLPSIQQLKDITANTTLPTYITAVSGVDYIRSTRYWSSSEYNDADAWYCTLNSNSVVPGAYAKSNDRSATDFYGPWLPEKSGGYVRSILTF